MSSTRLAEYNGHKNWGYWNVSLWLGNTEQLYKFCVSTLIMHRGDTAAAAEEIVDSLKSIGMERTGDYAEYTVPRVEAFLDGLEIEDVQ